MAKHSQSSKFTASGIFNGLNSFHELETRISALPLEKDRGNAFEVFAEAYLATQPICQVQQTVTDGVGDGVVTDVPVPIP